MATRGGPYPNIDFALATLTRVARMAPGSGEAIFALARCAGWIAHALEEYPYRLRFRPRAAYVGTPPFTGPGGARN
jgi:citrate synthase